MKRPLLPFASLLVLAAVLPSVLAEEKDGWISLFDGKSLEGWTQRNGTATYKVEDGAVVGTTSEGSPNSFLCTDRTFGDFELEFEVLLVDNPLNSGVQIRSQTRDDKPEERVNGPQVEIEATGSDGDGSESGYIYGEGTPRGWLSTDADRKPHKAFKNGEWNTYRVVARGPNIKTWINGEPIADLTDEEIHKTHAKGFIGLQVHGIAPNQGPYEVRWRNIRIKVLDEE